MFLASQQPEDKTLFMPKKVYVSSPFEMHTVPVCVTPGCFECVEAVSRCLVAAF